MKRMLLILAGILLVVFAGRQLFAEPSQERAKRWMNKMSAFGIAKTSAIASLGLWGLRNQCGNVLYHRSGFHFPQQGTKLHQLRPFVDIHYYFTEGRDVLRDHGNNFKKFHIAHRATAGIAIASGLYGLYTKLTDFIRSSKSSSKQAVKNYYEPCPYPREEND